MSRVLVVDDNDIFRQLIVEMLKEYPSLDVDEASSGEEAVEKVKASKPDLIFVDLELGDEHGFTTIQKIRVLDPKVKIAVLTSFDMPDYREIARSQNVDYFLIKGVSTHADIHSIVSKILNRAVTSKALVFDRDGEVLGFIEEVIMQKDSGRIVFGIVSFSFFNAPNILFPVPWEAFSSSENKKIIVNVDKEKLKHAPGFEGNMMPDFSDQELATKIYRYYGSEPFWQEDEESSFTQTSFEEEAFCTSRGTC